MMLIVYRTDTLPDGFIAIGFSESLGVIIERLQKEVKVVFRP